MGKPKDGDLRVWWVPQVPMKAFYVSVDNVVEAKLLLNALAEYDKFQLDNRIKPDYCNAGGLEVYENGEWVGWCSEEDGEDIDFYKLEELRKSSIYLRNFSPSG